MFREESLLYSFCILKKRPTCDATQTCVASFAAHDTAAGSSCDRIFVQKTWTILQSIECVQGQKERLLCIHQTVGPQKIRRVWCRQAARSWSRASPTPATLMGSANCWRGYGCIASLRRQILGRVC